MVYSGRMESPSSIDELSFGSGADELRAEHAAPSPVPSRPRRLRLPVLLFLATCLSTFWVGTTGWMTREWSTQAFDMPDSDWLMPVRRAVFGHWESGLQYMVTVGAILLAHEMGHFVAAHVHRIPASLPFFLPLPFSPIGTLGAVISMDGRRSDRRQIFDIGLAGPLAGLAIAFPVLWHGVQTLDLSQPGYGPLKLDLPIVVRWMLAARGTTLPSGDIWIGQVNSYFMAGWVGMLITGLNMLPVSQLDGGHVIHALFGRWAKWIGRSFLVAAIAFVVSAEEPLWTLMIVLVLLIGPDHPPTRDDRVPLGFTRRCIGFASLAIPVLCFPPFGLRVVA